MCVLCGEFVSHVHWTDHRHAGPTVSSGVTDPEAVHRERRRDRNRKAALANEVLGHYGLEVRDWNGTRYLLRDRKGRSEMVLDLGSLWPAAERLAGKPPDPLDPALWATLSARQGGDG